MIDTSKTYLAFYKGPPRGSLLDTAEHYAIRLRTMSLYSHAELVINGICYSSSSRDKGVRAKFIDLQSGRWDIIEVNIDRDYALTWFDEHDGQSYDWLGVASFVIPFIEGSKNKTFCFEAIGEALRLDHASKLTANDLLSWAMANRANTLAIV